MAAAHFLLTPVDALSDSMFLLAARLDGTTPGLALWSSWHVSAEVSQLNSVPGIMLRRHPTTCF